MVPQHVTIRVHDVQVDGFPERGAVAFIWDGEVFTGWPLIDRDGEYLDQTGFASPEQAKNAPLNVCWEASEDRVHGTFVGVRYWFPLDGLERFGAVTGDE